MILGSNISLIDGEVCGTPINSDLKVLQQKPENTKLGSSTVLSKSAFSSLFGCQLL